MLYVELMVWDKIILHCIKMNTVKHRVSAILDKFIF